MELDEETYLALSCQSSWDMWEFAVALHTCVIDRRERMREAVAWHRRIRKVEKRRQEREYYAKHKAVLNGAKRERAARAKADAIARGEKTPEQLKWERRKAKLRSVRDSVAAGLTERA